jgi:hypothetical protein
MSTVAFGQVYPGQGFSNVPTPQESAAAGGPAPDAGKLPMTAWIAMVVLLMILRLLWEYSG